MLFIGKLFLITLFLDPLDPEDGCRKLLQNVSACLVSHPWDLICWFIIPATGKHLKEHWHHTSFPDWCTSYNKCPLSLYCSLIEDFIFLGYDTASLYNWSRSRDWDSQALENEDGVFLWNIRSKFCSDTVAQLRQRVLSRYHHALMF